MGSSTDNREGNGRIQSVDRAVTVLELLARNGWSGVTEIAEALDVHKSTSFRLLNTLENRGLVEQHPDSGLYHLGFALVHLARAVTVGPDVARRTRGSCEWLAERTSETITLSVMEAGECITIDQILAASGVISRSWLGRRNPLHCTSPGKVFLAYQPPDRQAALTAGPHKRYTEHTIVDPATMRAALEQVRQDGYATNFEEFEEGLTAIAAPVFTADGRVQASISVSGPSYRFDDAELAAVTPVLLEATQLASTRFGYSAAEMSDS